MSPDAFTERESIVKEKCGVAMLDLTSTSFAERSRDAPKRAVRNAKFSRELTCSLSLTDPRHY
jgi:hypothetical protein